MPGECIRIENLTDEQFAEMSVCVKKHGWDEVLIDIREEYQLRRGDERLSAFVAGDEL